MCSVNNFKSRLQNTNERLRKYNAGQISAFCSNQDLVFFDEDGQAQLLESLDILLDIIEGLSGNSSSCPNDNDGPDLPKATPTTEQTTDVDILKSRITELQYNNTRLKIDLINRPSMSDLLDCQQRVKNLEKELVEYRNNMKSDQTQYMRNHKLLQDICILLDVDSIEAVIPHVITLQVQSQKVAEIQEDMRYVLGQLLDPSCNDDGSITNGGDGIDEYSIHYWQLARKTSREMKQSLAGMKALQDVFMKLYNSMDCGNCKSCITLSHQTTPIYNEGTTDVVINCNHMARLIHHWVKHRRHMKSAQYGILLEATQHFQRLFDVNSVENIYSTMTGVYHRVHEARTAKNNLIEILLGNSGLKSWESIVSTVHALVKDKTGGGRDDLVLMIRSKYPEGTDSQILQRLELSDTFYPVFYSTIQEIQHLLGVESLSAIIPAIKRMRITELS